MRVRTCNLNVVSKTPRLTNQPTPQHQHGARGAAQARIAPPAGPGHHGESLGAYGTRRRQHRIVRSMVHCGCVPPLSPRPRRQQGPKHSRTPRPPWSGPPCGQPGPQPPKYTTVFFARAPGTDTLHSQLLHITAAAGARRQIYGFNKFFARYISLSNTLATRYTLHAPFAPRGRRHRRLRAKGSRLYRLAPGHKVPRVPGCGSPFPSGGRRHSITKLHSSPPGASHPAPHHSCLMLQQQ